MQTFGVNHIDTAAFYPISAGGWVGTANELIRQALSPYPADLVIAVKVAPTTDGLARPDQLRGLVEQNLRQLGRDQLDLVYLRQHGLDSIAQHLGVLAGMRDEGLIRHLGLSNIRDAHLDQAAGVAPVVAVQNRYGIDAGRVNDDLLRTCGERGIAFVPFFAIVGEGRESGGVGSTDAVLEVARAHGVTPAQVRLAWTLHRGPHVLAIPGTGNPDHLVENIASADLRLTDDDLARLG
jgi:pyridoxine 4-dehydrogenase